jgi:hypothetical protein
MTDPVFAAIEPFIEAIRPVGSRVTCVPAPINTDADFLILPKDGRFMSVVGTILNAGFERGGSTIPDDGNRTDPSDRFVSFKKDDLNLIVVNSRPFFERFLAATSVAKRLNILAKPDRIVLFQAVLYGNPCDNEPVLNDLDDGMVF